MIPVPYHGYEFSPQLLRRAVLRALRIGWSTVARESGRLEARRLAALAEVGVIENAGGNAYAFYNRADSCESGAVLLDYAARVAHSHQSA